MRYVEVDLEEGLPFVEDALAYLKARMKAHDKCCLYVIHGYGSSGKGGAIREKVRSYLKAQEKKGAVKTVVFGEDFSVVNFKALELKNKCPELGKLFSVCNHGVTVVEL